MTDTKTEPRISVYTRGRSMPDTTPAELVRRMLDDDIGLRLTRSPRGEWIVRWDGDGSVLLCTTSWDHVVAFVCYVQCWDCAVVGAETVVMYAE